MNRRSSSHMHRPSQERDQKRRPWRVSARVIGAALLTGAGLLLAGGCQSGPAGSDAAVDAGELYEAFPPGAPQRCINVRQLASIEPVGNHTLLFYLRGGDVWRNRLDHSCSGLDRDTVFSYELRGSRLCSNDVIFQVNRFGDRLERGIGCALGEFDYLTEDQAEALRYYH